MGHLGLLGYGFREEVKSESARIVILVLTQTGTLEESKICFIEVLAIRGNVHVSYFHTL